MSNQINVVACPAPFSDAQRKFGAAPGSTIQDIIDGLVPDRLKNSGIAATIFINGEAVPREYWRSIKPKMGTLVNINIVPGDSGGGKKNPLATVLSIAVLIAAPYASAAILGGGIIASTATGAALISSGLTAAIGAVGRLAVSALAPPPRAGNAGQNIVSNPAQSPTQFIEGATNALNPYGVVPVCLGTNRMFPLQAARPYSETIDNHQYVRQLFTYGYGQEIVISDLKIGETSIEDFSDFELEHLLNGDLHVGTKLFSNDVFQENLNITLNEVDGFTTRTTQADIDEAIIDITFPAGLAQFNDNGRRIQKTVQLELQYAVAGVSPQDWTPTTTTYKAVSSDVVTFDAVPYKHSTQQNIMQRTDFIVVDKYSGAFSIIKGQDGYLTALPIPKNSIRLASVIVTTTRDIVTGILSTDIELTDVRNDAEFGKTLENSSSFVPSKTTTTTATLSSGGLLVDDLNISASQTEALRKSVRVVFPANGQYDIRIRRITFNSISEKVIDDVALTSIKSVKYSAPVNLQGINGTAVLIKATDQLNGTLDQYNVIASNVIPDYDPELDAWVNRITSNPASLYMYVLRGGANSKPLADSKIIFDDFESWWQTCRDEGYSYNRVIDYETSVDEILRDIAAAGAATPSVVDGKRTIAVDEIKDFIAQMVTPRTSWGYTGDIIYPETPHAFRVKFRNAERGYVQDELFVYADGFDETNATEFEELDLQSCTNSDLAFKTARRHIAAIELRPENHTFMQDIENLTYIRGDRIKFVHDVPIVGIGDGRIKSIQTSGDSPDTVTGFIIDDVVTIPSAATFYTRIRFNDGTFLYEELTTSIGETSTFVFQSPLAIGDTPKIGDLCSFVETGLELDLLITRIEPQNDLTARISAIDYAPGVQTAANAPIPVFSSKITTPLEFIRPTPPELITSQSDENVMIINSDGSLMSRAIFTLENMNDGNIETSVKVRTAGATSFANANVLEATPEILIIAGLEDGTRYDIHIRYRRTGSTMYSAPLEINNFLYVGASGTPEDVTGFSINVVDNVALLKWDKNQDIDISHYILKYSNVYAGAAYATAQILEGQVFDNRATVPFLGGTYLIKAVDLSGNESDAATAIITYDPGTIANAVETVTEHTGFSGTFDNTVKIGSSVALSDLSLTDGYYYFANQVDLTDVFPAFISAKVVANGVFLNDLFAITDLFAESDLFGGAENDLFAIDDLFAESDLFGIGGEGWEVELQYSTTQTDPGASPVTWSDWAVFEAGTVKFWGIKFRIKLTTLDGNISPQVTELSVIVDMPDRIERGDDLTVASGGTTISFTPEFKAIPAIAITLQDAATDDKIEYTSKTASGFTFKVYNDTLAAYVSRTYDYIASGYGRKNT